MESRMKKFVTVILALTTLLLSAFSSFASNGSGYRVSAESLGIEAPKTVDMSSSSPLPNGLNAMPEVVLDETLPQTRAQIGGPRDEIYFYYMLLQPIVENPQTHQVVVLNYTIGKKQECRGSFQTRFTQQETMKIYNDIIGKGWNLLGWQVKVKFSFDFNYPLAWTHTFTGGKPVTEPTPAPHNPYQTYIYTYNHFFMSDPMQRYTSLFSGSVHYFDKDKKVSGDKPFSAMTVFNGDM